MREFSPASVALEKSRFTKTSPNWRKPMRIFLGRFGGAALNLSF
jgi:hypothetical protein